MKILLLSPNSRREGSAEELPLITPPINLMYVAQILSDAGHKVEILDCYLKNLQEKEVLLYIKRRKPGMIGIPLYSSDLTAMHSLTLKLKSWDPTVRIVLAGHHVSVMPDEVLRDFPHVDYLVRGESEFVFRDLVDAIEDGADACNLPGISYLKDGKPIHTKDVGLVKDLDSIPIPSRKSIDIKDYYSRMSKVNPTDIIITSRGCPYHCTFCSRITPEFRSFRPRSVDNVIEEMALIQENGARAVEIYDEIYTYDMKRAELISKAMISEGIDMEYRIRTRVNHVNRLLLIALRKSGCSTISYGVESGNQEILDRVKKGTTLKQVETAFALTRKEGINILGFFMIGNPTETPQTIRQTIDFAKKLNPLFATFGHFVPFPGTPEYAVAKKEGSLVGEYAVGKPYPWYRLPWMESMDDIIRWSDTAYREYYHRPAYVAAFAGSVISQGNLNLAAYAIKNVLKNIRSINTL